MSPKIKQQDQTASIGSSALFDNNINIMPELNEPVLEVVPPKLITRNKYGLMS